LNIQRQYSLPNCILTLEGLDTTGNATKPGARPCLSVLLSAVCRFASNGQAVEGDRDFFEAMARAVSLYAQEILSGVRSPDLDQEDLLPVSLSRLDDQHHRLVVRQVRVEDPETGRTDDTRPQPLQLDLTTTQLFDLIETVDQFYADAQTLPDVHLVLSPVSRRHRAAQEPIAKRVAPAAIGISGLVVAASLLFLPPIPTVQPPRDTIREGLESEGDLPATPPTAATPASSPPDTQPSPSPEPTIAASPTPTPEASPTPTAPPDAAPPVATTEILDPTQLSALSRYLHSTLNQAWQERGNLDESVTYEVSVAADGSVVGYQGQDQAARDAQQQTPLPEVLYNPVDRQADAEPLALFKVVFTAGGVLQISPARGYSSEPDPAPVLEDAAVRDRTRQTLETNLQEAWTQSPSFEENLVFTVQTNDQGEISNYEPENDAAQEFQRQIPLGGLIDLAAGATQDSSGKVVLAPQLTYQVTFRPDGTLDVQ
jgi:hypothetical protein